MVDLVFVHECGWSGERFERCERWHEQVFMRVVETVPGVYEMPDLRCALQNANNKLKLVRINGKEV